MCDSDYLTCVKINYIKTIIVLAAFVLTGSVAFGQTLRGKVTATDTHKPVASANVFLSNTSVGTVTNEQGEFVIDHIPAGKYDLVVSFVGYESYILSIQSNKLPADLTIGLTPKINELQEVILEPYEKDGWQKFGLFFLENYIGTSAFAQECKLLNKEVVRFRLNKKTNVLTVTSTDRLVIENRALGYTLRYDLVKFEYNFSTRMLVYQGYPLFEEMTTNRERVKKRWIENRQYAYYGSLTHFMRSLYRNKLAEQDFQVRKLIKIPEEEKKRVNLIFQQKTREAMAAAKTRGIVLDKTLGIDADSLAYYKKVRLAPDSFNVLINTLLPGDSLAYLIDSVVIGFEFSDYLHIIYPKKKTPPEFYRFIHKREMDEPTTSELFRLGDEPILVWPNGSYHEGTNLITSGYWGWSEKMASLLPSDYWPPPRR